MDEIFRQYEQKPIELIDLVEPALILSDAEAEGKEARDFNRLQSLTVNGLW